MPEFDARDQARQVNVAGDNTGTIDASVHAAPPPPRRVVTTALRRDVGVFIDREVELQRILDAAGKASVHTVDGMAGVGKTALVTRAAHVLAPQFPDGRYFIDLHTHTPGHSPADPADVLGRLLIGLGTDPRNIPDSLEERRDQWRDQLSDKRVLLVLDDAGNRAQIEPLLPAGPGCLTLITSRQRLIALDAAKPLELAVPAPDLAVELFCALAHRPATTADDLRAVAQITQLCGRLPLAIALLAGRLAHHPTWTIPDLAAGFAATSDRLSELDVGDLAVYAAFTTSYQHLPPVRKQLFRHLGLHIGIDIDVAAAAALAGLPAPVVRRELDALYVDHLIDETMPGRYRLHDLLREYARVLAEADPAEDNDRAQDRLLDYYQHTALEADRHLAHATRPTRSVPTVFAADIAIRNFGDEVQALAWMRSERVNLLNCLEYAAAHQPSRVVQMTGALAGLLENDGPWPQAQQLHRRAHSTAGQLADQVGEANALIDLGRVHSLTEDYAAAIDLYQQALVRYRDLGNRLGEANALTYLGALRHWIGDDAGAAELRQSLAICREIGDRLGAANALVYLGALRQWVGGGSGVVELRQALALYRDVGYRFGEATTLMNLGFSHQRVGDYPEAADLCRAALVIYRELGHRFGEGTALTALGVVHHRTGNYAEAAAVLEQAQAILQEIGNRIGEANALGNLGIVRRLTGDYTGASTLLQRAVAILSELGSGFWEAIAFNEIGQLLTDTGELPKAVDVFTDALEFARSNHNAFEQARALEGLARCRTGLGERGKAITHLREAVEIYQHLGVPEAVPAAVYLATLENGTQAQ
ncbi:ATP-binding protein [Nocardia colli]|uniref:ATP-binding protein n=1 Tax=Nocardia colli TaxID=2545717 RepID=UPI0035E1D8CA